jgi:hypothetical protein
MLAFCVAKNHSEARKDRSDSLLRSEPQVLKISISRLRHLLSLKVSNLAGKEERLRRISEQVFDLSPEFEDDRPDVTRRSAMKKLIASLAISFACLCTFHEAKAQTTEKSPATAAKTMTISCIVSPDGKRIVSDKDEKSWAVTNPRILNGHFGDHVSAVVQVNVARNAVTVETIKVLDSGAANTLQSPTDNDDRLRAPQR